MADYNAPFFALYQNMFLHLRETLGDETATALMSGAVSRGLKVAYDIMGFEKGNVYDFVRVLEERDKTVGLEVHFAGVSEDRIVYQFLTNPSPNLPRDINPDVISRTYMDFKVRYLLGDDWSCRTTKHFLLGDDRIEHIIERKK